ncbi:group 3 secretory phospholipase A2 [Poecilia formosa]|uniref:phospholipase A2 n=1 Tax=Poecilia formosa TaxID=48698 RepID=A0A087XU27_POEFO|nr:PREDICTED: group 3 secretory phospholipase A2-like [Poecilia formosa]XP_007577361.1 PREDICTED: group 3 secretory phospholipase A2-like [Poecilia formosa]XP_016519157.1 PREDICTED: group 3 secretory phospholipase A2-like [Poecilia formosa]
MTHISALLALTVTSALLGCMAARASTHCSWTKVSSSGQLHVSFLRGDPHGSAAAPRLYHGVWSGERALLGCTWSDDAALIQSYLSACRGRTREFNDRAEKTLDLESLFDADRCVSLASPSFANLPEHTAGRHVRSLGDQGEGERSEVRIHARVKRGFIVPGTLWCGSGNKAPSYADLGVFSDTDSCCREHDQCKHTILSFQSDFGVFNSNIFTMSHCDCDDKFRSCLMEANDSIADVVGYTFFNLLKMHCFTFSHRLQCAERNWFGMCKKTQMALYADVHSPTLYESSESQEGCVNSTCSDVNSTASAQLQETNASRPHLLSSTAATDTVPASSPIPSVTAATEATNPTDAEASGSTVRRDGLGNVVPSTLVAVVGQHNAVTEEDRSCVLYKELDECKNKILPQQRKYGLHNTETGTIYHCNCTARLFHSLTQQRQLSKVETLLTGHVSQSCFLPQDCASSSNCTATVVKAELPRLDPTSVEVAEQRHLQAERWRGRRPGPTKAKKKDRAVRLYKLCVRMTRPKQTGKNRKRVQSAEQPRITGTQVN